MNYHEEIETCINCEKIRRAMFYCEHCGQQVPSSPAMRDLTKDQEKVTMDEINSARDRKNFFLYNDMIEDHEHPDAYFIIPSDLGYNIEHQYGCTGCSQFNIKGFAVPVPDPHLASLLEKLLDCDCHYNSKDIEQLSKDTGLEIESVWNEALAKLKNGWYVATCNCD